MTRLLSLSNELIYEIDKKLDSLTRKNFRLVCKQMNNVVMPGLFSRLVIKINSQRLDLTISQLQALALGTSQAARYVRTVEIRSLSPAMSPFPGGVDYIYVGGQKIVAEIPAASKVEWAHDNLREFLPLVLDSMKKVGTVIWDMKVPDPQWAQTIVSNFLLSLTNLEELAIQFPGVEYADLGLHRLTGLRKLYISGYPNELMMETESLAELIANSPGLSHFDIDCTYTGSNTSPTLHGFLRKVDRERPLRLHHLGAHACCVELNAATLRHLRDLKSLRLELLNSPTLHIFDTLRKEKIYVNALATDILDKTVPEYMASYTGMEQISLFHILNDEFASMFWDQVLPQHAETLVQLDIKPTYEGNWCFGDLAAQNLVKCKNLGTLSLALKRTDLVQNKMKTDAIARALTTVTGLPVLSRLGFFAASLPSSRGARCGTSSSIHRVRTQNTMKELIASLKFTPSAGVSAQAHPALFVGKSEFTFSTCNNEGSGYRLHDTGHSWCFCTTWICSDHFKG